MSLPLIIQVPADTTPTQWDQIHRALSDHRQANGAADLVSEFPPPAQSVPQPQPPAVPSLMDALTASQPAAAVVPPPVEPSGDPAWLQGFVMANNALPKVEDENWFHILADEAVQASSKGTAHEDAVLKLRRQAAAAKARWSKAHKNGNGSTAAAAQPATARMGGLADLLGSITPVAAVQPAPSKTAPAAAVIINLPSQLNDAQKAAVLTYQDNLVDGTKQAYLDAWLDGKPNPVTGQPITLDDFAATGDSRATDVATKVRRKVKSASA